MAKHSLQEEDVLPACIQELAKPVKELARMQAEEGKLIMVVELSAIENAIQLMEARVLGKSRKESNINLLIMCV